MVAIVGIGKAQAQERKLRFEIYQDAAKEFGLFVESLACLYVRSGQARGCNPLGQVPGTVSVTRLGKGTSRAEANGFNLNIAELAKPSNEAPARTRRCKW